MLIRGDDISELQFAVKHRIPRWQKLAPFLPGALLFGFVVALAAFTSLSVSFRGWAALLWFGAPLASLLIFSLIHKMQRPARPKWLKNPKLNWLAIQTTGTTLKVSGLQGAWRVLNRELDLAGLQVSFERLDVEPKPAKPDILFWRLKLTPEGEDPLPLWDIKGTEEEVYELVAALQEKVAWAEQAEGRGEDLVPDALKRGALDMKDPRRKTSEPTNVQ